MLWPSVSSSSWGWWYIQHREFLTKAYKTPEDISVFRTSQRFLELPKNKQWQNKDPDHLSLNANSAMSFSETVELLALQRPHSCANILWHLSHTSDSKTGTPVATLPGAWRYRVSAGWPGVSILWLGEVKSWICNFYLSVAARKIVWADQSLRYTSNVAGALSNQHQTYAMIQSNMHVLMIWCVLTLAHKTHNYTSTKQQHKNNHQTSKEHPLYLWQ